MSDNTPPDEKKLVRDFFEKFVERSYKDYTDNPNDSYLYYVSCIMHVQLLDHFYEYCKDEISLLFKIPNTDEKVDFKESKHTKKLKDNWPGFQRVCADTNRVKHKRPYDLKKEKKLHPDNADKEGHSATFEVSPSFTTIEKDKNSLNAVHEAFKDFIESNFNNI